ncbi:hypothetical protein AAG906_019344 [Vitis piasezkii]
MSESRSVFKARSHPSANLGTQKSAPYDGKSGSKDHLFDDVDTGNPIMGDPTREMQKNMPSSTGQAPAQN